MLYENLINKSLGSIESLPTIKMNFSINAKPEIKEIPTKTNFSENPVESINDYITKCFSLLERIKLSTKSPRQVLKSRIKEIVRYCKANDRSTIDLNRSIIIQYLSEYVYQIIMDCLSNPAVNKINLIMILGLGSIMDNMNTVQDLQDILRKAKIELENTGSINKNVQNKLSKAYAKFWTELLYAIEETYFPQEKKGTLVHREKGLFIK